MSRASRELKRIAGMILSRLPDLKLEKVDDRRRREGRRWKLPAVLRTLLVGVAAGCNSVADIESLTERMSSAMRRKLGIYRRLPDTTAREILIRLEPYELRQSLHAFIHAAARRKSLPCEGLPFHVVSMDGKGTSLPYWDHHFAQQNTHEVTKHSFGLVRTVTTCLISTAAKPIIDCFPIPADTNEMGIFPHAFESLLRSYGNLFQLVTYDAGVPSQENCQLVVDAMKDFFFRIKNENWHTHKEAKRLLGSRDESKALAHSEDVLDNHTTVVRSVFLARAPRLSTIWSSVKTLVRVHTSRFKDGQLVAEENKYYISSLSSDSLSPTQWLTVSRDHWAVENNGHWTLDAIFKEDSRPWIESAPRGTVAVMVLRRIAYSMLAIFRAVTLRSEENRSLPWKDLLQWVSDALIAIADHDLNALRPRTNELHATL